MTHYAISPTFAVFLLASLALALTPGPAVIYLLTRTLSEGRRVGLTSISGVALGNFGNACVASLGLAALLAISAHAFTAVKLAGAAYLVYLGARELRAGRRIRGEPRPPGSETRSRHPVCDRAFRDGFLVALLNPKTAIFFGAFLPQFVDPRGSALGQTLGLGAVFVSIAACTDTMYVLAADRLGPRIARLGGRPGVARYMAGFSYIALGLFVAYGDSRSAR